MMYHQKSPVIFFSIILLSIAAVFYLYSSNRQPTKVNPNIFWEEASIQIKTNWGECPSSFPCYETYRLNSALATKGNIFHNNELEGNLSEGETRKLIKVAYNLYQSNKCTPFYTTNVSENYELRIEGRIYEFGNDQGCKEMQEVVDTLRK